MKSPTDLSDHEHEKSEHQHDKELRKIPTNAKNHQTLIFRNFLNWLSKNCQPCDFCDFLQTHEKSQFLQLRANLDLSTIL